MCRQLRRRRFRIGQSAAVSGRTTRQLNKSRAFSLLHELRTTEYRVDAKGWRPDEAVAQRRSRPGRAEALRASHDAYVRVKLARSHADTRGAVLHDEVMAEARAVIDAVERKSASAA